MPSADEDDDEYQKAQDRHRQDAGQDKSIAQRLEQTPETPDARLDAGLDESMDASDPPAATQPGTNDEPPASSGYDAEEERSRAG